MDGVGGGLGLQAGGFVLAGGKSTRMGRDKALLELDGETLVARAVRSLGEVCAEVTIAGGSEELARFGRMVPDVRVGCGPLGGIVSALEWTTFEWNVFLAVDVPFVPAAAWRHMLGWAEGSEAMAVLPEVAGRKQPLCGVYSRACAGMLRRELVAGRLKVTAALDAAGPVHLMRFTDADWFRNLNTPDEFAELS